MQRAPETLLSVSITARTAKGKALGRQELEFSGPDAASEANVEFPAPPQPSQTPQAPAEPFFTYADIKVLAW